LLLLYTLLRSTIRLRAKSINDKSFARAFMLILHIVLVVFIVDAFKIDYLRNRIYIFFIWYIFGLIAATHNIIVSENRKLESRVVKGS